MAQLLFELRGIHFSYPGRIPGLSGVDLAIEEGSRTAIIGANGTGKSTLLFMLDGLIFPHSGSVRAFGRELTESALNDEAFGRSFRSTVGFVFQNPDVQLFCPSVREEIAFGPLQLGVQEQEVKKRLEQMVETFKLSPLLERSPHQLSLGEKKKVAIASVLANNPTVLLLDEPTSGLDPQTTRDIIDIITAENGRKKTIVTATHDLHIVEEVADTVHVFGSEKRIVRSADPCSILSDPEFLQAHNLIHIHRHRHKDTVHTHPHVHLEHHVDTGKE